MTDSIKVDEAPEEKWALWRDLRLEALEDSPGAFGATLAQTRAQTEADWRSWWHQPPVGPRFIATVDGVPGGMCSICFPADHGYEPLLISMWTAPRARRRGLGRRLLEASVDWCAAAGYKQLRLGVVRDNLAAAALYTDFGFVDTGRSEPLLSNPEKAIVWMRLPFDAPRSAAAEV